MSKAAQELPRMVRLSVKIYRWSLAVYPQTFRREYGAQMAQVFRDACRETAQTSGNAGLWRYWLAATGDLIVNALAEHRQKEFVMTRMFWVRLGSLAAIIGGATGAILAGLSLTSAVAQLLDENSPLGPAIFQAHTIMWGAPSLVLLYLLTLIGMQAGGADRAGVPGWVGITAALLGATIAGLGYGLFASVMYSQADSCFSLHNCNFYDPNHYASMGVMVGLLGTVIFIPGMILYSVMALRRRILPRYNWLPLAAAIIALLNIAASFIALLVNGGSDGAGVQKVAIMLNSLSLAFAIVWILLGVALWPKRAAANVLQNPVPSIP